MGGQVVSQVAEASEAEWVARNTGVGSGAATGAAGGDRHGTNLLSPFLSPPSPSHLLPRHKLQRLLARRKRAVPAIAQGGAHSAAAHPSKHGHSAHRAAAPRLVAVLGVHAAAAQRVAVGCRAGRGGAGGWVAALRENGGCGWAGGSGHGMRRVVHPCKATQATPPNLQPAPQCHACHACWPPASLGLPLALVSTQAPACRCASQRASVCSDSAFSACTTTARAMIARQEAT